MIAGRAIVSILPEDDVSPRTRQRREVEQLARWQAQRQGGEVDRWIDDLTPLGKAFDDRFLTKAGFKLAKEYDYTSPLGDLLYQSLRYEHRTVPRLKKFLQRRKDPDSGLWIFGAGAAKVPYRWPFLNVDPTADVYACEGEKDADRLASMGLCSTTVAGQNWSETATEALRDRDVVIMEDNDAIGRKNAASLAEKLLGVAKSIRVCLLPDLPHKGDVSDWLDAGHPKEELLTFSAALPLHNLSHEPYQFPEERSLAPWDFLYGPHMMRATVSGTAGAGEVGKSTKRIADALAMVSGRPLLGVSPSRPLRVLLVNLEDDRNVMDKRVVAAMKHYGLTSEDVGGRLFVIAKGEFKLKVASQAHAGAVKRNHAVIGELIKYLKERKIDVFSFDPLRKTHLVNENDPVAMGEVIEIYEEIAEEANCNVSFCHHLRKGNGSEATIDSVRGTSVIVDAPRSCEVMEKMTRAEARACGIDENRRRHYFKSYNGKINFAPPIEQVDWFEIKSVELENHPVVGGDSVGVVTRFYPAEQIQTQLSSMAIAEIKAQVGTEPRWKEYPTSNMWVGKAVAPILGLDPEEDRAALRSVIKKLIAAGVLKTVQALDRARREEKTFVVVNPPPEQAG